MSGPGDQTTRAKVQQGVGNGDGQAITVTLYSRPGCHLCAGMKASIERVRQRIAFALIDVDISTDAELEARYGTEIPVLLIAGRTAAKYRISEAELTRKLEVVR